MRRLFWFSVGAAAGYYVARRGERAVEEARERGLVGNVTLAASTASRLTAGATRTAATLGEAAGGAVRRLADDRRAAATEAALPDPAAPTPAPSREVRP